MSRQGTRAASKRKQEESDESDETPQSTASEDSYPTLLEQGIMSAPEDEIRNILVALCRHKGSVRSLVRPRLLTSDPKKRGYMTGKTPKQWRLDRKAWEKCEHCGMHYHVERNAREHDPDGCSYLYHPGRRELHIDDDLHNNDEDDDDNIKVESLVDDDESAFNDAYRWTCCGEAAYEKGCTRVERNPPTGADKGSKRFLLCSGK